MQFSLVLSTAYADAKLSNYDSHIGKFTVDVLYEQAELAEQLGFDMVSVSAYHRGPISQLSNAAVLAAALSRRFKKLRIALIGPLTGLNDPVRIAEEVALLDAISEGRVSLVPVRCTPNEVSCGTNPDGTRERAQEAQALIARALDEPEPFSWEGRYFRIPTVAVWRGQTQQPHLIWSSGDSEASVVYAARHRFPLGISFSPLQIARDLTDLYRAEATKTGWQPTPQDILYRSYVACAETDRESSDIESRYYGNLASVKNGELKSAPGDLTFKGSPQTLITQFTEWYETAGIGVFDCCFTGGGLSVEETNRSLKVFGATVIPVLKEVGVSRNYEGIR